MPPAKRLLKLLTIATLLACGGTALAESDLAEPEAAVQAGSDALGEHWGLPWYDSESDDFRPVDLPKPRKPWWIWEWLGDLFSNWNLDLGDALIFLGWLLVLVLLVWIVIALIRAYVQSDHLQAAEAAQRHDAREHIERVEALPVALEEPISDFLHAARKAQESGDLTRAIVYLFSYELIELDRHSLLRLVKGKTNRQYLRELERNAPDRPRLADILRRTTRVFEAAFFGAHPPTSESFSACWQEAAEFQRLLTPVEEPA